MIKNSIKQLFRTPLRTLLYFLLIVFVGILFSLGINLWAYSQNKIDAYEKHFKTIGTFEQEYNVIEKVERWDATIKDYCIIQEKTYGELIREKDLLFEGVNYIKEPEFRPTILAHAPQYFESHDYRYVVYAMPTLIEFEPLEDAPLGDSVPVKVVKMLTEQYEGIDYGINENDNIFICQHFTSNPLPLEKGKVYVATFFSTGENQPHGMHADDYLEKYEIDTMFWGEFAPEPLTSSQADIEGREVSGPIAKSEVSKDAPAFYEVTKGFYETENGARYLDYIKGESMAVPTLEVTGTNSTQLLISFHEGDAYIIDGRDINTKEYQDGDKVCLISKDVADMNGLKPGNMVNLDFLSVNFGSRYKSKVTLNANAKAYDIYVRDQYKIVGIYKDENAYKSNLPSFYLSSWEVIVPKKSIKEVDYSDNIASYAPMTASKTSFQIKNGEIDSFMEAFNKSGLEDKLSVVFYDGGYSQLEAGIQQMKVLSLVFLALGIILMIFIIILFTNIYISNNIFTTMIERTLGITKARCLLSLLSGVVLIIVIGSLAGGITGGVVSEKFAESSTFEDYYSRDFSRNIISLSDKELEEIEPLTTTKQTTIVCTGISISIIIVFGLLIAFIKAINNIKQEPLKLLSARKE